MSNEIKQGDKVRVSKDAPKMYVREWAENRYCKVAEVEDDNAIITDGSYILAIPCKYLVKVDVKAKEAKFKKGDKVKYVGKEHPEYWGEVFTVDGEIFYNDYHKNMQIDSVRCEKYNLCNVPLSDLEPYTEGAIPTIKVGDRVRKDCLRGIVKEVTPGNVIVDLVDSDGKSLNIGLFDVWMIDSVESIEPTEQTETSADVLGEFPPISMSINPIIGFKQEYWTRYTADLAKELAIAYGKRGKSPLDAVAAAKEITKRLKQK